MAALGVLAGAYCLVKTVWLLYIAGVDLRAESRFGIRELVVTSPAMGVLLLVSVEVDSVLLVTLFAIFLVAAIQLWNYRYRDVYSLGRGA